MHTRRVSFDLSHKPEELFDANGVPVPDIRDVAPTGTKRLGTAPYANGSIAGSSAGLNCARLATAPGHRHGQSPQRLQALGKTPPLGIHATQSVCEDLLHERQREKRVLVHQEEKPPLIDRRQTTI